MNRSTLSAGFDLESEATLPRWISFTDRPLMLKPTLSPTEAESKVSWCISTDFTSAWTPLCGENLATIPGFRQPVSTRPTGTVPMPWILYTSCSGRRSGRPEARFGGLTLSRAVNRVFCVYFFLFLVSQYHGVLSDLSIMLSPLKPEMGMNLALPKKPFCLQKSLTPPMISLKRFSQNASGLVASILFMQMIIFLTPKVLASCMCSLVEPSLPQPASNSFGADEIIRAAMSACDVPVIMFLMKSRWPGGQAWLHQ